MIFIWHSGVIAINYQISVITTVNMFFKERFQADLCLSMFIYVYLWSVQRNLHWLNLLMHFKKFKNGDRFLKEIVRPVLAFQNYLGG